MIPTHYFLFLAGIVFTIGIFGLLINRRNLLVTLMAIELLLLATNINFVGFSAGLQDLTGQVFSLFVLTIAAAEAAIGLAIFVVSYRKRHSLRVDDLNILKG